MSDFMLYTSANGTIAKLKEAMRSVSNEEKWKTVLPMLQQLIKDFGDKEDIRSQAVKVTDLVQSALADLGLSKRAASKAGYSTKGGRNVAMFAPLPSSTMAYVTMLNTPVETLKKRVDTWYSSTRPTSESGEQFT